MFLKLKVSVSSHVNEAITAMVEGKLGKSLKKILKKVVAKEAHEQLAITDTKLGGVIKVKTGSGRSKFHINLYQ